MQRDIEQLKDIAEKIMKANEDNTSFQNETVINWPVGYALYVACCMENKEYARRIEAAFPELINEFIEVEEGKS